MKTLDRFRKCENDIVDEYLSSKLNEREEILPNIKSSSSSNSSEQEEGTVLHSDQMNELLENDSVREQETATEVDLPEKKFTTNTFSVFCHIALLHCIYIVIMTT